MKDALIVSLLSVVPKSPTARMMGRFTRLRLPRTFHRMLVGWFVRKYKVNLDECQGGIDDFPSLARFFIRELRPGVRPIDPDPDILTSPVDGRVHTFGRIEGGKFLQAEGMFGSVARLLGDGDSRLPADASFLASRYEGGSFAIIYLSPQDYHRVHSPREGTLAAWRYLPGQLWPVFPAATRKIDGLFDKNERLVFILDTSLGKVAVAMIGAFGVGRMSTDLANVTTNTRKVAEEEILDAPRPIARGGELGRFEMGSTVVLLAEPGALDWTLERGAVVRLGRPIATKR